MKYKFFTKTSFYIFLSAIFLYLLSYISYLGVLPSAIGFFLILIFGLILAFAKPSDSFLFLIFELLIGHDGHLFEFKGISIRLALFAVVMSVWFVKKIFRKESFKALKSNLAWPFLILLIFIVFGAWSGILRHNTRTIIFGDIINYSYILLFLPLYEFKNSFKFKQKLLEIIGGAILAQFCFSFFVLFIFASGMTYVHGPFGFYWWLRQAATAKVTKMDFHFFRVVSADHLLVLPIFLIYLAILLARKKNIIISKWTVVILATLASFIILVNFGRAYFLGIIGSLFFLSIKINWKKWLRFSLIVILLLVIEMSLILFVCSRFESRSFSVLNQRLSSVLAPSNEISALSREARLEAIDNLLSKNFIFGTGLGTTVSSYDPVLNENIITYHLDWGYLEMWLELSIFGLFSFLYFLYIIFRTGLKKIDFNQENSLLKYAFLSGLFSLSIMTVTGPYFFHALGISYLALSAAIIGQPKIKSV